MRLSVSIAEACDLLGLGRTTLYAAINAGELEARKVGRRTVITVEALQRFLENCPPAGARSAGALRKQPR